MAEPRAASGILGDLAFRGLVHQVTGEGLAELLDREETTVYAGFDPTADSLQVGNLVPLLMLVRLSLAGHRGIALIGGATGLVGDPSGKAGERSLLDPAQVRASAGAIRAQVAELAPDLVVLDNVSWLEQMGFLDFLRETGKHFTVNQMVAKESVRARIERPEQGISYTEFSYMLLQAADFLHLSETEGCRLQIGASDQWGNITAGVELVRKAHGAVVWGLTAPLLVDEAGRKLGKTESGTIWLDKRRSSPYAMYQAMLRTSDGDVGAFLRALTFLGVEEILELDGATRDRPAARLAQRVLAREVCTFVHGKEAALSAERASAALYSEAIALLDEETLLEVFAEAPATTLSRAVLDGPGMPVVEALVTSGLSGSKGAARRAIAQGGVYVNNVKVEDAEAVVERRGLLHDRYTVLRRGKREYHLFRFE